MKYSVVFVLLTVFSFQVLYAQHRISGKVVDDQQRSIPGVTVITEDAISTITDSSGRFFFDLENVPTNFFLSHVAFESKTITVAGDSVFVIVLNPLSITLSETIVNSFERNSSIKNIPAAVSVLNKESLSRYSDESLVPAMNTVPGVKMDERSPGSYRISIRGNLLRSPFGVRNVKVYWNGIPFTDASGNTYINQIAFNNIDKIEILKGPSGSMYGSGTGGVVLLSSNISTVKEKSVSIHTNAGSYGSFSAGASYDQSTTKLNSSVSVSHQQADGYRDHANMRRDVANLSGTYIINSKQNISVNIFYSDLYYKTPGGLTQAELNLNPKQARPAAGIFQSAQTQKAALYLKTIYAGLAHDYRFNNQWRNTTAVYFSNTDFKNPTIRNYERKTENGFGLRSVTKFDFRKLSTVFGVEFQQGFSNTGTYGNRLGVKDTLQYRDDIDSRQVNVFLQTDVELPAGFTLNGGISYNNFYYGFKRLNEIPVVKQSSNFDPQFIPRISLLKKIKDVVSVYASWSKGYSPPSIDEVHASDGNFNRALNAETGLNYEAGIKADLFNHKLSFDASYYLFRLENTIVSRRDSSGGDYFVNAGKTNQKGLELSVSYLAIQQQQSFIRLLKFWSNYTNIHARFTNYTQGSSKFDGNKLTGTPPNVFLFGVDLNLAAGFYANLTYNYTDIIPLNDANTFFGSQYNLFFAKVGCKTSLGKKLQADIFLAYDKSFNEPYSLGNDLNAAGNRYFNPSAPENINGGLRLKFIL